MSIWEMVLLEVIDESGFTRKEVYSLSLIDMHRTLQEQFKFYSNPAHSVYKVTQNGEFVALVKGTQFALVYEKHIKEFEKILEKMQRKLIDEYDDIAAYEGIGLKIIKVPNDCEILL